jgi:hypothetical protein
VATSVRRSFAAVLGVEPSSDDSFVSLGGDSLSYVEMSIRLEQVLGTLPRDWHTRSIDDLTSQPAPPSTLARIDTTVVLRAVAIVLIVGSQHPSLGHHRRRPHAARHRRHEPRPVPSRTLRDGGERGPDRRAHACAGSVAVAAFSDEWRWPNALLVNGWLGTSGDPWGYWYIEALVQIVVPLAALLAVPAVRRLDRRAPFGVAVAAVVAGLVVRFDVVVDVDTAWTMSRPHEVFWIFAVGWAAGRATTTPQRLLVSALALAGLPRLLRRGGPRSWSWRSGSCSRCGCPPAAATSPSGGRGWLAGASLYTYLTHYQVYPPLLRQHGPLAAVVGSLVVGIVVWLVARRAVPAGSERSAGLRRRVAVLRRNFVAGLGTIAGCPVTSSWPQSSRPSRSSSCGGGCARWTSESSDGGPTASVRRWTTRPGRRSPERCDRGPQAAAPAGGCCGHRRRRRPRVHEPRRPRTVHRTSPARSPASPGSSAPPSVRSSPRSPSSSARPAGVSPPWSGGGGSTTSPVPVRGLRWWWRPSWRRSQPCGRPRPPDERLG